MTQEIYYEKFKSLCDKFVRKRLDELRLVLGRLDKMSLSGLHRTTFEFDFLSISTSLLSPLIVILDTINEILSAFAVVDVLNANVDLLGDNPCPEEKVDINESLTETISSICTRNVNSTWCSNVT